MSLPSARVTRSTTVATRSDWWWLGVCLVGNATLEAIDVLRHSGTGYRSTVALIVGSGPNVAAVLAIAGAAVPVLVSAPVFARRMWGTARRINAALLATVLGLLTWEFAQPLTARGVFDWRDVMATVITGGGLAVVWPRIRRLTYVTDADPGRGAPASAAR